MISCIFRILKLSILAIILAVLVILAIGIYATIKVDTYHTTESAKNLPIAENGCALLLGTSKYLTAGGVNRYYTERIDATIRLYKAGVVNRIIISGDNRDKYYNEPDRMKADILKLGVPSNRIITDPKGLRTYESIKRCKDVYGVLNPIIISQEFHCRRALYIADKLGLEAVGYATSERSGNWQWRSALREFFARILAVFDVYILKGAFDVPW